MRSSSILKLVLACCFTGSLLLLTSFGSPDELFERRVLPVLEQNCWMCHGSTTQRSGLDLRTKEALLRGGSRGPAVVPGKAEASLLYQLITHSQEPSMPMGGARLADAAIASIREWITGLPPEDHKLLPQTTSPLRSPGSPITEQDRNFWSFRKPERPEAPKVKDAGWVRNEVDAFVGSRLEEKGLKPSPPAEPRVLLRRLYLDLIGLPPSPEEVNAFLADRSGSAYERTVDRLLASPRYGERWGRHWLDLARYGDSGGFEFDYDRPHAWRYRDYVIESFNQNKPYNVFIKEQLAADEMYPGKPEALIATGFCRNGPTVDNASNEQTRMDELDDMISTTSSVFLGLTVGCARCHDHKYDPIPQRDYYRMQAIFMPSQKTDRLLVTPDEESAFKSRIKQLDEEAKPYREEIAAIEKPARDQLLAEKVDFFTRLAAQAGALEGKDPEEYRRTLAARFAKDVKLQNEEIESRLSPDQLRTRKELQGKIDAINRTRPKPLATVMGISDKEGEPPRGFLLKRGDFRQKGEEVTPGFPSVLGETVPISEPPAGTEGTTRRRQLGEWIAGPDNPLTARVAVNRIWQHHFGKGLVRTASDFGANGDRPSHPELLDWLATEFVAKGWNLKEMHRLMVTSSTYRQSSWWESQKAEFDPENRLLWRMNPRRLEAEVIRDSVLAVSGTLNNAMGGTGIYPRIDPSVISTGSTNKWPLDVREGSEVWRRSIYIFIKRSVILPMIEVFDGPDTTVSSPVRNTSTIAPQALALLNNDFVLEQAALFARRVLNGSSRTPREQIEQAFQLALGRKPRDAELRWSEEFLARQLNSYAKQLEKTAAVSEDKNELRRSVGLPDALPAGDEARQAALRDFCHALFNLSEFLYVD